MDKPDAYPNRRRDTTVTSNTGRWLAEAELIQSMCSKEWLDELKQAGIVDENNRLISPRKEISK